MSDIKVIVHPEWTDPDRWELLVTETETEFHAATEALGQRVEAVLAWAGTQAKGRYQ